MQAAGRNDSENRSYYNQTDRAQGVAAARIHNQRAGKIMPNRTTKLDLWKSTLSERVHPQDNQPNQFAASDAMLISMADTMPVTRDSLTTHLTATYLGANQGWPLIGGNASNRPACEAWKVYFKASIGTGYQYDLLISNRMVPYQWNRDFSTGGTFVRAYQYTTGTVTTSGTNSTVTGTGTFWLQNAAIGYYIKFAPATTLFPIVTIPSNTQLTVTGTPPAYTGENYVIYAVNEDQNVFFPHVDRWGSSITIFSYPTVASVGPVFTPRGMGPFVCTSQDISSNFTRICSTIEANDFAILHGYVVLGNVVEWNGTNPWTHTNNRICWSAPASYSDFTGTGSGQMDVPDIGAITWLMASKSSIFMFGSEGIGALRPTGDSNAPFSIQVVAPELSSYSNPVNVNGSIYFWGRDGLMYKATDSGIEQVPTPVSLNRYLEGITGDSNVYFSFSENGRRFVTDVGNDTYIASENLQSWHTMDWPQQTGYSYRYAFAKQNAAWDGDLVCAAYDDYVTTDASGLFLQTDPALRTTDGGTVGARYYPYIQTHPITVSGEKEQVCVKYVYIRTYFDSNSSMVNDPDIVLVYRSGDEPDGTWKDCSQIQETVTLVNGSTSCTAAVNALSSIKVADYFQSGSVFYRITNSSTTGSTRTFYLDRAVAAADAGSASHRTAKQIHIRDWEETFGVNAIMDKIELKVYVIARQNSTSAVKVVGLSIEYAELGRRFEKEGD